MGDPDKLPADGDRPLGDSPVPHPWGHASVRSSAAGRLTLVEVEGELDAPAVGHWRDLVNSAIMEGATGIVVDLRGCHAIDIGCLSVLVAASGKLKERGDGGVNMVTTPGSPLRRMVQATGAKRLDGYASAGEALRALRDCA